MQANAPGWIRTSDLRIRSPLLYPAELRGLTAQWQRTHQGSRRSGPLDRLTRGTEMVAAGHPGEHTQRFPELRPRHVQTVREEGYLDKIEQKRVESGHEQLGSRGR
jgi:hypothetical protein